MVQTRYQWMITGFLLGHRKWKCWINDRWEDKYEGADIKWEKIYTNEYGKCRHSQGKILRNGENVVITLPIMEETWKDDDDGDKGELHIIPAPSLWNGFHNDPAWFLRTVLYTVHLHALLPQECLAWQSFHSQTEIIKRISYYCSLQWIS